MQTSWRLERTYLTGAGFPESRLEGLDVNWSDPFGPTGHAALWADNGTGKTTITALHFGLYLPHARDFIRGDSDRSLAKLVRSGDVCHVVEQATRVIDGELQRIVMGMVANWADGGTQDMDNPRKLHRIFYGWVTYGSGPSIDDLPFRTSVGRRTTHSQFVDAVRTLQPDRGVLPPHRPSDHQTSWRKWLAAAGIDLEQLRFQGEMNASEGGVDHVMRFADSDGFVRWLIGATTPTTTVEQIGNSIDVLRTNAAARPLWSDELALWERITEPLMRLAIVHDEVATSRRAVATAEADAAAVVADAEATLASLSVEKVAADELYAKHESRRREATATLRRAQAHRLRMQLRAAKLRADGAATVATQRRLARDEAARDLAAWQLVANVLEANATRSRLAGLTERRDAAEKQTAELHAEERRHRHSLARLLTDHRDRAARGLDKAEAQLKSVTTDLRTAERDLRTTVAEHATADEKARQAQEQITESEQAISDAVVSGLLPEGADPATAEASWARKETTARQARQAADEALKVIDEQTTREQQAVSQAQKRSAAARNDADNVERRRKQVNDRVDSLANDERLRDAVGDISAELWTARPALTDALQQRAAAADTEAGSAQSAAAAAQRTLDAVGADGLLPASHLAEEVAQSCQDADVPAWPGWRWLADTMTAEDAAAFAMARPEIASGVVIAHTDLLDRAVAAVGAWDIELDMAVWIGAVLDPQAAASSGTTDGEGGTHAKVLLPHPGVFDREAAGEMVAAATDALAAANQRHQAATRRATDARDVLAALAQLWKELPHDPRAGLTEKIRSAEERWRDAQTAEHSATAKLQELAQSKSNRLREREYAQQVMDEATEVRRHLAPVITAAAALSGASERLPGLRNAATEFKRRIHQLSETMPSLTDAVEGARELVRSSRRQRDNATEALREASLSATTDGPVPTEDATTIRARLESVESALADAAVDPELRQQIIEARQSLADLEVTLDADPERRCLAEQFAATDDARHQVALNTATMHAAELEGLAREAFAKAQQAAETAQKDYEQRAEDSSDRSSPDVEGFPPEKLASTAEEADRFAEQLDELAGQLLLTQRSEEQLGREAQATASAADQSTQLVAATVSSLQYLADSALTGQRANDIPELITRIRRVADQARDTQQALSGCQQAQQGAANTVRAHANGPQARKVEEAGDPRVIDLISRLRGDEQLPAEAERIAGQLEERAVSLRDDLESHDRHVHNCATLLHVQATRALQRLRAYQNQSRLPEGLGEWSQRRFVIIEHETVPADESVAVDRVARVVHALLTPGAGRSDAQSLLFAAARALVDAPFRVRLLKPHTDLSLDRVDVAELKNFSGGQRVTAGVLLYATMTKVRATGDTTSVGWLWLDNPFGQASADQFVRTMRRAADQLGLQLLFTAAPKDKGALSMFDRTIMLGRRSRPSSGEKVVVIDDGTHDVVDLVLVQQDVMAVLGE